MSIVDQLNDRVTFQKRGPNTDDDNLGDWEAGFEVAAGITYLRGRTSDEITEQRLQSRSPVIVRVWSSAATRGVGLDWRAIDKRTGVVISLRTFEPSQDRQFIDFMGIAARVDA